MVRSMAEIMAVGHRDGEASAEAFENSQKVRLPGIAVMTEEQTGDLAHERSLGNKLKILRHSSNLGELLMVLEEQDVRLLLVCKILASQHQCEIAEISTGELPMGRTWNQHGPRFGCLVGDMIGGQRIKLLQGVGILFQQRVRRRSIEDRQARLAMDRLQDVGTIAVGTIELGFRRHGLVVQQRQQFVG